MTLQPPRYRPHLKWVEPLAPGGVWTLRSRREVLLLTQAQLARYARLHLHTVQSTEELHTTPTHPTRRVWLRVLRLPFWTHRLLFWEPHYCDQWDGRWVPLGSAGAKVCQLYGTCYTWMPHEDPDAQLAAARDRAERSAERDAELEARDPYDPNWGVEPD